MKDFTEQISQDLAKLDTLNERHSFQDTEANESYTDWKPLKGFVYKTLQDIVYYSNEDIEDKLALNPNFNLDGMLTALERTDEGIIIPAGSRIEIVNIEYGKVVANISKAGVPIDKAVELPINDVNNNFNEILKLETIAQDVALSENFKFKVYLKADSDLTDVSICNRSIELMRVSISDLYSLSAAINRAIYIAKTRELLN